MKFSRIIGAAPVVLLVGSASAFWRMECRGRSALARLDPLVNPGAVAAHAHSVHGSSGFSATSGTAELLAGDCTSCAVTEDKSAYWTPPLYFKDASTGKFEIVNQVGGILAYYFLNYSPGEDNITAFPSGFEMLGGDTNQRNFTLPVPDPEKSLWASDPDQSSQFGLMQKSKGFNCLNYDIAAEGSLYRHFMPDKEYLDANCKDGIRVELMFPSCWNGKDLTSDDNRSHVAYPSTVMTGSCPPEFPVRLPGLFYEVIWDTAAFKGTDGEFVFSNGDPTGYGYHGDFIMGWEENVLQDAVDTCTNESGRIEDCSLFTIQSEAESKECVVKDIFPALKIEDLEGPMNGLPGGVKVSSGPAYVNGHHGGAASSASAAPVPTLSHLAASELPAASDAPLPTVSVPSVSVPSVSVPSVSSKASTTAASSGTGLPGGVFAEGSGGAKAPAAALVAKPEAIEAAEPSTTPAPSAPALKANQQIYTTSYVTKGGQVIEVVMIEEFTTVTERPVTATKYVSGKKRHAHRHAGRA